MDQQSNQTNQINQQNTEPAQVPTPVSEPVIDAKSRSRCVKLCFIYAAISIIVMILLRMGLFTQTHVSTGNAIDDLKAISSTASTTSGIMFIVKALVIIPLISIIMTAKSNNIKLFENITKTNFGRASILVMIAALLNILFSSLGVIIGGVCVAVAGYILKTNKTR